MMWQGKKNTAQGIFYDAMEKIQERTSDDPLKLSRRPWRTPSRCWK